MCALAVGFQVDAHARRYLDGVTALVRASLVGAADPGLVLPVVPGPGPPDLPANPSQTLRLGSPGSDSESESDLEFNFKLPVNKFKFNLRLPVALALAGLAYWQADMASESSR